MVGRWEAWAFGERFSGGIKAKGRTSFFCFFILANLAQLPPPVGVAFHHRGSRYELGCRPDRRSGNLHPFRTNLVTVLVPNTVPVQGVGTCTRYASYLMKNHLHDVHDFSTTAVDLLIMLTTKN